MISLIEFMIVIIILVASITPRFLAACSTEMTWDEATYTFGGVTAIANILHKRFSSKDWEFEFHPPLGMIFIGATYGVYIFLKTIFGNKHPSEETLGEEGIRFFRGQRALLVIRSPSIIFGGLTTVLVFLMALNISDNYMIALTAALLTALAPNFVAWTSVAMLESTISLLYTASIFAMISSFTSNGHISLVFTIVSGLLFGLLVGTKISGMTTIPVFMIWYLFETFYFGITSLYYMTLWLTVGISVYVLVNPVLWKNPIKTFIRNLNDQRSLFKTHKKERSTYHIEKILATTPLPIFLAAFAGLVSLLWASNHALILVTLGAFVPLLVMSLPGLPKYGVNISIFMLPSICVLSALGIFKIESALSIPFHILDVIVILLVGYSLVRIFPYFVGYQNFASALITSSNEYLGYWGEGLSKAIQYAEDRAKTSSTVWAYAPKSTILYHSSRGNLRNTFGDEPFFVLRQKAGHTVAVDNGLYDLRDGDIRYYFPYYYKLSLNDIEQVLKQGRVEFIILYKAALSEIWKMSTGQGNNAFCKFLHEDCKPVYTVSLKKIQVAWVFQIDHNFLEKLEILNKSVAN